MSEARAAHHANPEIGDVLASIRRLISQEDAGPDFAQPVRRMDASGKARSALPLGPKAELLRTVIERELSAVEFAEDRLILRGEVAGDHGSDRNDASGDDVSSDTATTEFDEDAYQMAVSAGLNGRDRGSAAKASPIPPHRSAAQTAETHVKENDMMLAEVSRNDSKLDTDTNRGEGFDLFAAESVEEDDQMAGGNALRNLVRDVIRQELQGELGDRISRNLRRAIRQEVTAAIESGLKTA